MVKYFGRKNQFNYDIEQLKVDYDNKTYEIGIFTHLSKSDYLSKKQYENKINELKLSGFTREQ